MRAWYAVVGDLSPNFNRAELACPCSECDFDTVDYALIVLLEQIREHFDRPVWITSGSRCKTYNAAIGGSEYSQHMLGKAADIVVDGTPPELVQELAHNLGAPGLGRYSTFTHVDVRKGMARWSV